MKLLTLFALLSIPLFGDVLYWQINVNTQSPYEFVNNIKENEPYKVKEYEFNYLKDSVNSIQRLMLFEMLCDGDLDWILVKPNESEIRFNWIEVENIN